MNENIHQPEQQPHKPVPPEQDTGNAQAVRDGLNRHGEAFLAYLILDGVEQRGPDIVEQFEARYYGYWPSVEDFVQREFVARDLQGQLAQWAEYFGMTPAVLEWNQGELASQILRPFRTTERLGGVYVFTR